MKLDQSWSDGASAEPKEKKFSWKLSPEVWETPHHIMWQQVHYVRWEDKKEKNETLLESGKEKEEDSVLELAILSA